MKSLIIGAALIGSAAFMSTAAAKTPLLVRGDDSVFTEACVAAVHSMSYVKSSLSKTGYDVSNLRCNGMTLARFVSSVKSSSRAQARLVPASSTAETRLCIAAATSDDAFAEVRAESFSDEPHKISQVRCNNMPLADFARRHGNGDLQI